jgi:dolichyl-phosphate-mannose-protein mannosyltransferase
MVAAVITALIVLLAAALGRRIFVLVRFRFDSLTQQFCFSAVLGLGVVSFAVMGIGLAGALNSPATLIGLVVAGLLLLYDAGRLVIDGVTHIKAIRWRTLTAFQWFLIAAIALSLAMAFVSCLAPPTAWDATTSHVKVPVHYLAQGGIYRLDDIHSNGPMNAVMLFMLLMDFGGETAPALLSLAFVAIGGLALLDAGRRWLSKSGALLAAAVYFLMPLTAVLGSEPVVDFPVVAAIVLAFIAFERWWSDERAGWLVLSAVCIGLAAGTKYTGLYALAGLCAGVSVKAIIGRGRRVTLFSHAAAAVLIAVAVGCPWYVRNVVHTGNPFYPILAETIPTRHISAASTGQASHVGQPRPYPTDLLNTLLFPVNVTLGFGRGWRAGPQAEGVIHSPGALLLALVPLILLLRPVPRWAWLAVAFAALSFVMIIPGFPLMRYVLPFLAPCVLVAGWAFDRLSGRAWVRRVLVGAVVIVLAFQLLPFAGRAAGRWRVAAGVESRRDYLMRVDDVYPMARRALSLPDGSKIFYVGERLYYFLTETGSGVVVDMGMPLRQAVVDFPLLATPRDLIERLRGLGYTHLIVNEAALATRFKPALSMIDVLRDSGQLEELDRKKTLTLYRISEGGGGE